MPYWWETGGKDLTKNQKNILQSEPPPDIIQTSNQPAHEAPNNNKSERSPIMADENQIVMEDGSVETFGAKKKMLKATNLNGDGSITTQLKFANGRVITFEMPDSMVKRFAMFGSDQKFGDNIAGLEDIDDCILATETMIERLVAGEWSAKREGSGMGGTSILVRALVEHTGKTVDTIKEFLAGKTQAEKLALRNNTRIKPIVDRLEAEKVSKKAGVDTDAMLDELG
jgi:hypothetical protein